MAGMSVDGLVSGLNTTELVSQLMQAEAMPQTQLKNKVTTQKSVVTALQAINTQFMLVLSAAKDVAKDSTWNSMKATSSSTKASGVSVGGAVEGSVTFSVGALARAESEVSAEFSAIGDLLPGGTGKITLENGKGKLEVDGTSLSAVVSAINADKTLGLSAAAVSVGNGRYRLQVTAKETGADSAFTMSGLGATTTVQQASDAEIFLGGPATGVKVVSPRNTFPGLLSGTDVTVGEVTGTETVTVSVAADKQAATAKVKGLVDAANAALAEISKHAASSGSSKGVLAGDSTVRALSGKVLGAVSSTLGGSLATFGVEVSREGRLTLDTEKFDAAYAADPAAARAAFGGGSTVTPAAGVPTGALSVTGNASPMKVGQRDVVVTRAAAQASGQVAAGGASSVADGSSLEIKLGGKTVSVTAVGTETLASLATRLDKAARSAGLAATATYDPDTNSIAVVAKDFGASVALAVSGTGSFGPATVTAGEDVAGTIGGVAARGAGQQLTATDGIAVRVDLDAAGLAAVPGGLLGTLTDATGLGSRLRAVADEATRSGTGKLTTAIQGRNSQIKDTETRVTDWDRRLEMRRTALTRQFSAMEVALSKMNQQSSWLAGQIAGLPSWS
jgi:flagellar hook-associated protein 2